MTRSKHHNHDLADVIQRTVQSLIVPLYFANTFKKKSHHLSSIIFHSVLDTLAHKILEIKADASTTEPNHVIWAIIYNINISKSLVSIRVDLNPELWIPEPSSFCDCSAVVFTKFQNVVKMYKYFSTEFPSCYWD